jgi:hypothetical protein
MTDQHPITPPPIVREQWQLESPFKVVSLEREDYMIDRAAQWGADQELEKCCECIPKRTSWDAERLRAARRPKPPSLKEQALELVRKIEGTGSPWALSEPIRRALEALDD